MIGESDRMRLKTKQIRCRNRSSKVDQNTLSPNDDGVIDPFVRREVNHNLDLFCGELKIQKFDNDQYSSSCGMNLVAKHLQLL
jgi:hypothetical protein